MPFSELYRAQAELLIRVLPFVGRELCFALKGGTAINLFLRDMPRLSVDIDLTYLPVEPREESLTAIDAALKRIAEAVRSHSPVEHITEQPLRDEKVITRLIARDGTVQIKIEVTPVLRGCVYEPAMLPVSSAVEETFGYAEIQVVSFADLYAGKIVATLDRQHPRDLFDVMYLLSKEGINGELRRAFIIYLISHNRPMSEVIAPTRKDISIEYERGFQGMTENDVSLESLTDAREALIVDIIGKMPDEHRRFLISFERGTPDWSLLGLESVSDLPAVRWRQQNLDKLDKRAREKLVARLEDVLRR